MMERMSRPGGRGRVSPPALSCSVLLYPGPGNSTRAANEHESILRDCLFSVIEKSDGSFAALVLQRPPIPQSWQQCACSSCSTVQCTLQPTPAVNLIVTISRTSAGYIPANINNLTFLFNCEQSTILQQQRKVPQIRKRYRLAGFVSKDTSQLLFIKVSKVKNRNSTLVLHLHIIFIAFLFLILLIC